MTGYIIRVDGRDYIGWRDGRPFTLADAWHETEGVAHSQIVAPTGRIVLDNAGSMQVRAGVPWLAACRHIAAVHLRNAPFVRTCPVCGVRCWRYRANGAWWHPSAVGCDLEMFTDDYVPSPPSTHPFEVVARLDVEP